MKKIFSFILIAIFSELSFAQHLQFRNYSVGEGLPRSQVRCIMQDSRGYLWIGTYGGGATRFDGKDFRSYTTKDGLPHNVVQSIIEDTKGNLWFGTNNGVAKFDGRKIEMMASDKGFPEEIILDIFQDSRGNIWFGTVNDGIFRYDGKTLTNFRTKDGLCSDQIWSIEENRNGDMWFGSYGGGASRFDGKNFYTYKIYNNYYTDRVLSILADRKGNVWLATLGAGIYMYDGASFKTYNKENGLLSNSVYCVYEDADGNIWIGYKGNGLSKYDPSASLGASGKKFVHYTMENGLSDNDVSVIFQDREKNIWIGTQNGGLNKFSGETFSYLTQKEGLTSSIVQSIYEDSKGNIWFGMAGGGACKYDFKKMMSLTTHEGLSSDYVNTIIEDDEGKIWFGTNEDGISQWNGRQFRNFRFSDELRENGLQSNMIWDALKDSHGQLWFCTNRGASKWEQNKFINYIIPQDSFASFIRTGMVDASGNIWFASMGKGLYRYDGLTVQKFNPENIFAHELIWNLLSDKDGNVLIGTENTGLLRLTYRTDNFLKNKMDTILDIHDVDGSAIVSMVFDDYNNLWLGTTKGIIRFNYNSYLLTGKKEIQFFRKEDGVIGGECNKNAVLKDSKGFLWFGTVAGAVRINPNEIHKNSFAPQINISDVRLFYSPVDDWSAYTDSMVSKTTIPYKPLFPFNKNHLTFDYIGISLTVPEKVRYQYKLEGFDEDWRPVTDETRAYYSNLPAGEFTFLLKASNNDGVWNEKPVSFAFTISPPLRSTWWFRITGIAVLGFIVWAVFYLRIKTIQDREKRKTELNRRISGIELKALQAQMDPHFIFNALNSIQQFVVKNDAESANDYLVKFAHLMRLILNHSRNKTVSLSEEIEALELYLELESLRFKSKFEYKIEIEPGINKNNIELPTMLIQPYVENAIKHGINYIASDGEIEVSFRMIGETMLACSISDNGIGRKKSAELKSPHPVGRESLGMRITKDRLDLINEFREKKIELKVTDRMDKNRQVMGTRVELFIPLDEDEDSSG